MGSGAVLFERPVMNGNSAGVGRIRPAGGTRCRGDPGGGGHESHTPCKRPP